MEVISAWELYLWTRLGVVEFIGILSGLFIVVWMLIACVSAIAGAGCREDDADKLRYPRMIKHGCLKIAAIIFFISILFPTKKEAAIIFVLPQIANNPDIQQEAGEIYGIAKDALREFTPDKKAH